MALVEKSRSFDEKWEGTRQRARRAALGGDWVCGLTSVGLTWAQVPRRPGGNGRASRPPRANAGRDDLVEGVLDPRAGIGLESLSFHGLSLGSAWSPEVGEQFRGDRHELAHAALDWFRVPGSDPPYLLHEGWAMSQCGDGRLELARAAADSRHRILRSGSVSYWARLVSPGLRARLLGGRCLRRFLGPDPRRRHGSAGSTSNASRIRSRQNAGKSSRRLSTTWRLSSGTTCRKQLGCKGQGCKGHAPQCQINSPP